MERRFQMAIDWNKLIGLPKIDGVTVGDPDKDDHDSAWYGLMPMSDMELNQIWTDVYGNGYSNRVIANVWEYAFNGDHKFFNFNDTSLDYPRALRLREVVDIRRRLTVNDLHIDKNAAYDLPGDINILTIQPSGWTDEEIFKSEWGIDFQHYTEYHCTDRHLTAEDGTVVGNLTIDIRKYTPVTTHPTDYIEIVNHYNQDCIYTSTTAGSKYTQYNRNVDIVDLQGTAICTVNYNYFQLNDNTLTLPLYLNGGYEIVSLAENVNNNSNYYNQDQRLNYRQYTYDNIPLQDTNDDVIATCSISIRKFDYDVRSCSADGIYPEKSKIEILNIYNITPADGIQFESEIDTIGVVNSQYNNARPETETQLGQDFIPAPVMYNLNAPMKDYPGLFIGYGKAKKRFATIAPQKYTYTFKSDAGVQVDRDIEIRLVRNGSMFPPGFSVSLSLVDITDDSNWATIKDIEPFYQERTDVFSLKYGKEEESYLQRYDEYLLVYRMEPLSILGTRFEDSTLKIVFNTEIEQPWIVPEITKTWDYNDDIVGTVYTYPIIVYDNHHFADHVENVLLLAQEEESEGYIRYFDAETDLYYNISE
jgi:hypothetical protein